MVMGIQNSLNSVLSRINSIESDFDALNNISEQLSQTNSINQDFQKILDAKIQEANVSKETNTKDVKVSEKTSDVAEKTEKVNPDEKLDKEIKELENQLNLKQKISLNSQKSDIDEIIDTFASKYDVDSDFIKAIIQRESNFNTKATSKKGAMGLMQLMPATAKSLGVINAYNPWENIEGGVKHLKGLLNTYNGDKKLALAAYNAGGGAVKKYGGIPPYKETQNYVKSIMSNYNSIKGAKS